MAKSNVNRLDYLKTIAVADTLEVISPVVGTSLLSRAFIIQNQDDVEMKVGNMILPVGAERVYSGLEVGGTDVLWDSEDISVQSTKAGHKYAVEHFEVAI